MKLKLGFDGEYWLSSVSCTVRQGFPEIGAPKEITELMKLATRDRHTHDLVKHFFLASAILRKKDYNQIVKM